MSRWLPYLSELQPEIFCEVSPELAAERGLEHGGLGDDRHRARPRSRPGCWSPSGCGRCDGAGPHGSTRSGCPTTGARNGLATGDSANDLVGVALDPNVHIQESKALACDIRPGRRPRGPALRGWCGEYRAAGRYHRRHRHGAQ